jgi:hypothetical protein
MTLPSIHDQVVTCHDCGYDLLVRDAEPHDIDCEWWMCSDREACDDRQRETELLQES